jgi:hypothetical protein
MITSFISTNFSSASATVTGIDIFFLVVYFYLGIKIARKPSPTAIPDFVENSSKPIVIYVHGMYGCYLSNKTNKNDNNNKVIEKSFELPSSIFKSFFSGNNGHTNLALPITWNSSSSSSSSSDVSANDNDDGNDNILQQDIDDIYPSDDFSKWRIFSFHILFLFLLFFNLLNIPSTFRDWTSRIDPIFR